MWPRWRDALVLVQPATVDRWHRDGFVGVVAPFATSWKTPHRGAMPRSDRAIGRGEPFLGRAADPRRVLKLGIAVSERTVSRYLREQPKRPSQSWRTFLANHLGQFDVPLSQILSSHASDDAIVDAFTTTWCPTSVGRLYVAASRQCALFVLLGSASGSDALGLTYLGPQDHLRDRTGVRRSTGRAPPRTGLLGSGRTAGAV